MNNPQNILSFLNNSASVYLINLDLQGRYVYVNNLFRKIFGYKEYEILEKSFEATIFPEDIPDFQQTIDDCLARPGESFVIDLRKPRSDGSLFWTRWEFSAVADTDGKPAGIRGVGTDITERKRAEFERQKTQEYLQSILNNTDESFILIDRDLNILSYNVAASKLIFEIFGVHLKKGLPMLMFIDEQRYEAAEKTYLEALSGKEIEIESTNDLKSGGQKVLLSSMKPVYTDSGELQGVMITSRDVTARKRAEEQLVNNERHFRALIENSADAMIIVTPDGQFKDISPSALRILGYTEKELSEMRKSDIVHPEDLQVIRQAFLDVIKMPGAIRTIEVRVHSSSDNSIWLHATLHNLLHEPSIGGVVINFNDVTRRKLIEKALQDSEEKYRFLFYASPQPMWIYDLKDFRFVEVNEAAVKHYGYSHEEFRSMTLLDIRPEEDVEELRKRLAVLNLHRGLSHSPQVWRHKKKNGELVYVEIKSNNIEYSGQPSMIVSINDITNKVKAEQDLIRSNERFQYAVKATSEAIWEWDTSTGEVYIADAYTKMLGWIVKPDRKFEEWYDYLHPEEKDAVIADLNAALDDPSRDLWQSEYRYRKPDGDYAYVADRAWIIRDEMGKVLKLVGSLKDMTESKQFEQEILKSNERFELAGKATSDAIWDADLAKDTIHWGEGFRTLFGYSISEDAEGRTWMDHIHEDDLDRVAKEHYRVINDTNETFWSDEYRFYRKDGSIAYVTDKGLIMRDEHGKAFRIIGAMQDITERKKAEERLAEERNLLRTLIDHLPDSVYVKDTQFRHIINNAASVVSMGASSEEETVGKTVFDFFDKETAERFTTQERAIMRTREPMINVEEHIVNPDGQHQWLLTTKVPLIDEQNRVVGIVGVSRDISERKQILEDLRESNERFSIISRATTEAIYDWNIKENHLFWNEALASIFNLKEDEINDTFEWWREHIHPDDQPGVVKNLQYHIDNKIDHWQYEYRFLCGDGKYKYVYDRGYILNDQSGKPYRMIGAMMDMTERKKLEDALAAHMVNRQRQITEATIQGQEKERSEIGRELHDNINQILTTTKLYIDMAINDEEIREELLNKSYSNISRAIEEIRVLSKTLVPPSLKDIGLREAITELVDNLNIAQKVQIRLKSSGVRKAEIAGNIKLMVYRIVQEQLNNILKHARATEAEIKLVVSEKMLNITVLDNGVGFDPRKKAKGIGLNNIASRAELHNGRVEIISAPGKGCTLRVAIPI